MSFEIENFKEVGGPGNSRDGGQLYSVFSETDLLQTMLTAGYLNQIINTLNAKDFIFLSGIDGSVMAQVDAATSGNVQISDFFGGVDVITDTQTGAVDSSLKTRLTTVATDSSTPTNLILSDGLSEGQRKTIILVTDGGQNLTVTPGNFADGGQIVFADAKDFVELLWTSVLGWKVIVNNGGAIS